MASFWWLLDFSAALMYKEYREQAQSAYFNRLLNKMQHHMTFTHFLPLIFFHLFHTIQSPVLVIWFLTLWSLPGFWQAIHSSELCAWLLRFCRTRKSLQFYIPVSCTSSIPLALASNCLGHFPEGKASLQTRLAWKLPCFDFNLKSKLHQACAASAGIVTGFLNCYQ